MLDWTDRHCRLFLRQLTRRALLYTEMVTTGAVLHGDRELLLGHAPEERPLALQLGGDDPAALAACARIAEDLGYDEVNLNVGCPSDRVQQGRFGACLMATPEVVAEAVAAMRAAVRLPVTVKHRIGVVGSLREAGPAAETRERYEDLVAFVHTVAAAGADRFIVHARVAVLAGLSPKANRTVPPLRHADVHRLKAEHPALAIEVNGGVHTVDDVLAHLAHVDGVMVGRAAYADPFAFATADRRVFGAGGPLPTREGVVLALCDHADRLAAAGQPAHRLTRHMLGLFAHQPGGRAWRRALSEATRSGRQGAQVLRAALALVPEEVRRARPGEEPPPAAAE
jgi:tRNA-dihydrouridine synthase A